MFVNYLLALLLTFLGLYTGALLAFMTTEELKPGRKYFLLLKKVLLVLIFVFSVIDLYTHQYYIWLIMVFVLIAYLIKKHTHMVNSIFLGCVFYLSSYNDNSFIITTSLIFLYTLPIGTLMFKKKIKPTMKSILANYYLYLVAPLILYYVKI